MIDYSKLRNGSDIRGVAIEIPGGKPINLNEESTRNIGSAFALWAGKRLNRPACELRIAIGRDSRLSGEQLTKGLGMGISAVGAKAFDCGMASTPAMFMCCVNELHFDAGIMVTASHLPMERNGMKFFIESGGLEKEDIAEILRSAAEIRLAEDCLAKDCLTEDCSAEECLTEDRLTKNCLAEDCSAEECLPASSESMDKADVMTPYINGLKRMILKGLGASEADKPLSGLKIVVDAGNGAGGFFAERLLLPLGADISGSRFLEPDGRFPNHQPNPENPEAMESICEAVRESKADFGIIFDTDVDRAGAVLPCGEGTLALDRNRLIALMTAILNKQYGSITVVTDSITSTGLSEFISSLGCKHHRFKRGYRNVINEAKRLMSEGENAVFAMETSGHGALYENYFLDDGAYIIVKLLIELVNAKRSGSTLDALIATLNEPEEGAEARLAVMLEDTAQYTASVLEAVERHFTDLEGFTIVHPNYEGVRVSADAEHGGGWFLIRRSLHDPIMPCNLESNYSGGLRLLASALLDAVKQFDKLDTEPLRRLC